MTDEADVDIPVPLTFFSDVMPRCRDLSGLKATLAVLEAAGRRASHFVALEDLLGTRESNRDAESHEPVEARMRRALDRAVADGALIRVRASDEKGDCDYFLVATTAHADLAERIRQKDPGALGQVPGPLLGEIEVSRPNAYAIYERHIGPLTPFVAEQLRDVEKAYPRNWVELAITTASENNRRNWKFVQTLLSRWEETGAPRGINELRR